MSSSVNRSVDYVKVVDALADVVKELNRGAPAEFADPAAPGFEAAAAAAAEHGATDQRNASHKAIFLAKATFENNKVSVSDVNLRPANLMFYVCDPTKATVSDVKRYIRSQLRLPSDKQLYLGYGRDWSSWSEWGDRTDITLAKIGSTTSPWSPPLTNYKTGGRIEDQKVFAYRWQ
jgi:hypothetical protein